MILLIDTSEELTKIALHEDNLSVIREKECTLNGNLSERLLLEVDQILKEAKCGISDLTKIYVNEGPGSYTGLRIGITTANFIAYSLDIPIIGFKNGERTANRKKDDLYGKGFVSPVIPSYSRPPHITKSGLV